MSSKPKPEFDPELELFAGRFFKSHGAAVETRADHIEVLLPEDLAADLETAEYIRIARGAGSAGESAPDAAYSLNYGSSLLEKMVDAACAQVPLLACELRFDYLKSQGFDQLIREQFHFSGSVGQAVSLAEIRTDYLFLTCRYTAQSDEQKEGLIDLVFNAETGVQVPGMAPMIAFAAKVYRTDFKSRQWDDERIQTVMQWVQRQAEAAIAAETGPFQESMNRRYRRDAANLKEYYASLKLEMEQSLERPGLSEALIEDRRSKIAMLPDELTRKQDDLFKKYSIKVSVSLCGAMWIATPAVKILYRAAIGRRHKNLSLIYNPVTKALDALVCESCGRGTYRVCFCDRLRLLCPNCSKTGSVC